MIAGPGTIHKLRGAGLAVLMAAGLAGGVTAAEKLAKPDTSRSEIQSIEVVARPLAGFEKLNASRTNFGALEWLGGLVLSADDKRFGGWSGLALDADGSRLVAVSDAGTWMTADLVYRNGGPVGLARARLGPLKARNGGRLKRSRPRCGGCAFDSWVVGTRAASDRLRAESSLGPLRHQRGWRCATVALHQHAEGCAANALS